LTVIWIDNGTNPFNSVNVRAAGPTVPSYATALFIGPIGWARNGSRHRS
jgi:hypothetical protein